MTDEDISDVVTEGFAAGALLAAHMSGLPVSKWRSCFLYGMRMHEVARARERGFEEGTDYSTWRTSALVTGLVACLGIGAPDGLIKAARLRASTQAAALSADVRAEHDDYPDVLIMLDTALALVVPRSAEMKVH